MKNLNLKLVLAAGFMATSLAAYALEAGPFVYSGKVTASTDKTVTLEIGEREAEVPMKLVPKNKLKDGKVETGTKLTIAVTEEESKTVKVRKK